MIRVRKIAHVTYETPDVERQTGYYTGVQRRKRAER